MSDLNNICVICSQEVKNGGVTVTKGINTLIKCSIQRNDEIHKSLANVCSIKVHPICRQNYTRPSNIKAAFKAQNSEPSTSQHFLRELETTFDFKHDCLLCGKNAVIDPKLPSKYRTQIHEVSTIEIKQTLLNACDDRNDDWAFNVKPRLLDVIDLVAAEARYHGQCYKTFCKSNSEQKVGRPLAVKSADQFNLLVNYLENDNECQYSLKDLRAIVAQLSGSDVDYTDYYLKSKLVERFKDRLVVHNISGRKSILCMSHTSHKVLDTWYKSRETSTEEERKRIVRTAAEIVREDIQKMNYDCGKYSCEKEVSTISNDMIPETLTLFTSIVTKKRTGNLSPDISRKRAVINHTIISAVRPRSFLSSIQTSLSLYLNRMYGSKHLIEVLSALGVCSSYYESDRYLRSLISQGPPDIQSNSFKQYVFDNADVNIRSLDGLNTFHAMGGIACITPASHVSVTSEVPRLVEGSFKVSEEIRKRSYVKRKTSGLANIVMEDFSDVISLRNTNANTVSFINPLNLLWVSGCNTQPGWNGFMSVSTRTLKCHDTSYLLAVPFIDIDPNSPSSVYTALCFAAEECNKNKETCIVTFDQPLYLKAMEIVAGSETQSHLSKIVVRLGGFHLLMSYLGCIGRVMEGSGIESLWETVYGKATVKYMLNGHAFARAVRAYILTYAAIVQTVTENESVRETVFCNDVQKVYDKLYRSEISQPTACGDTAVQSAVSKFTDLINLKKSESRTSKLWLNLIKQIDLMLNFILAERTGNWILHLDTITDMLPYFHAAGHIPYAKSAHMYAQEMKNLKSKLTEEEYELFVTKGFFTIRRKEEFWAGNWSDMCIEQSLMKSLKSIGGLTHGRGITESTLNKWVLGAPSFLRISEAFRMFLGLNYNTHEQHVELRESRKSRDLQDLSKFKDWFSLHNPFNCSTSELISLSTGLVCDSSVNCDDAYEVGLRAMQNMVGKPFSEIKLHRKDMVKTQASFKCVKVRSKEVSINPQQIFNRIICVCDSPVKLKSYFEFELASHPPSLFDDTLLRKGTKASFMKVFEDGIIEKSFEANEAIFVIDGGYLLHAMVWRKNITFNEIVGSYLTYIRLKYGNKVTVVFDGYPNYPTTKQQEQERRASKKFFSPTILFDENTVCTTQQADFLSNPHNKKRLIEAVTRRCVGEAIEVCSAEDDADTVIANQAIKYVQTNNTTVVVGTDTDLLVLLVALAPQNNAKLFFLKPSSSASKVYSVDVLINQRVDQQTLLLFAHSMTGCDTTSAFYGLGKLKASDLILKSAEAKSQADHFIRQDTPKETLLEKGEQFILTMYSLSKFKTLNEARYFKFKQLTAKMSLKSNFDLAKLPPTSDAAHQHILRVYHQIQTWLGYKLPAEEWGWHYSSNNRLIPKPMTTPPAPNEILLLISCNCKALCVTNCSCRKAGFDCTYMCGHCSGMNCNNVSDITDEILENEEL